MHDENLNIWPAMSVDEKLVIMRMLADDLEKDDERQRAYADLTAYDIRLILEPITYGEPEMTPEQKITALQKLAYALDGQEGPEGGRTDAMAYDIQQVIDGRPQCVLWTDDPVDWVRLSETHSVAGRLECLEKTADHGTRGR